MEAGCIDYYRARVPAEYPGPETVLSSGFRVIFL